MSATQASRPPLSLEQFHSRFLFCLDTVALLQYALMTARESKKMGHMYAALSLLHSNLESLTETAEPAALALLATGEMRHVN
ncbi:hypothetical protein [Desulfovibrio sp. QI0434]